MHAEYDQIRFNFVLFIPILPSSVHVSAFDPGLGVRLAEQEAEARRLDAQKDKTKMCESDPAADR